MNTKRAIPNFIAGLAILFALAFQSLHGLEHLSGFLEEKHCEHHYADNENQISHSHHEAEDCFSCEFTFSHATPPDLFVARCEVATENFERVFKCDPQGDYATNCTRLQLRGPPEFIV